MHNTIVRKHCTSKSGSAIKQFVVFVQFVLLYMVNLSGLFHDLVFSQQFLIHPSEADRPPAGNVVSSDYVHHAHQRQSSAHIHMAAREIT